MRSANKTSSSGLGALLVGCAATLFIASRWERGAERCRLGAHHLPPLLPLSRRRALPGPRLFLQNCARQSSPLSLLNPTALMPLQVTDQ